MELESLGSWALLESDTLAWTIQPRTIGPSDSWCPFQLPPGCCLWLSYGSVLSLPTKFGVTFVESDVHSLAVTLQGGRSSLCFHMLAGEKLITDFHSLIPWGWGWTWYFHFGHKTKPPRRSGKPLLILLSIFAKRVLSKKKHEKHENVSWKKQK